MVQPGRSQSPGLREPANILIPYGFGPGSPVLLTGLVKNAHQFVASHDSVDKGRLTGAQRGLPPRVFLPQPRGLRKGAVSFPAVPSALGEA
jgi:hypothetical protein